MVCRIADMRHKEVVNVKDGTKLGYIDDVEFDTTTLSLPRWLFMARRGFSACLAGKKILL